MTAFLQQVLTGLADGGIYAAIALALVMIYRTTHRVNFAQGEFAMLSTYVAALLIDAGLPYWLSFVLTVAVSFTGGMAVERFVMRPFRNASVIGVVMVFVGLLMIVNAAAGWLFGYTMRAFPSPFPPALGLRGVVPAHELGTILVVLAMLGLIYGFFHFTSLGLAMRAVAENHASSELVGIRVGRMLALGWGLASAVGAVAGMMAAPVVFLDPNMMSGILVYGFAAALLGGIENPWGAAAGGFLVGVIENLAGAYLVGTELKLTLALVLIVCVLLIRPTGLFGRTLTVRV